MNAEQELEQVKKGAVDVCRRYAALLALNWQRLEELREIEFPTEQESFEKEEMEELLGDCGVTDEQEALDYLSNVPLDITCNSGNVSLSDWPPRYPDSVAVLLATGGPAYRLWIDLDGGKFGVDVQRVRVQAQDWGTPWVDATFDPDILADLLPLAEFWTCALFAD
ncbi:MAG: hypothetical protein ACK6D3_06450 [Planctomycetaceae bacterium]|jgi:hypothetical protein